MLVNGALNSVNGGSESSEVGLAVMRQNRRPPPSTTQATVQSRRKVVFLSLATTIPPGFRSLHHPRQGRLCIIDGGNERTRSDGGLRKAQGRLHPFHHAIPVSLSPTQEQGIEMRKNLIVTVYNLIVTIDICINFSSTVHVCKSTCAKFYEDLVKMTKNHDSVREIYIYIFL